MVGLTTPRYTRHEAARLLGITTKTLDRWRRPESAPKGVILEPMRLGGRLYYTEELIADWQRRVDQRRERLRRKGA